MSENAPEEAPEEAPDATGAASQELADPVRTGVADVDAVLDAVDELDTLPVDEHVTVYESAHEGLRGALDPDSDA